MRSPIFIKSENCQRKVIAKYEGYEVKTEGDSFMVAFDDPTKAVHFCLQVQEDLFDAPWPEELFKISGVYVLQDEAGECHDSNFEF